MKHHLLLPVLLILMTCGTANSQEKARPASMPARPESNNRNSEPKENSRHESNVDSSAESGGRPTGGIGATIAMASPALSPTAVEIQKDCPSVSATTLMMDEEVVRASLPDIAKAFSRRGLKEDDARRAAEYGWWELRAFKLSPDQTLEPTAFIQYVSGLGMRVVRSTPSRAMVEIDGKPQPGKTEYTAFPSTGEHRV